MTLLPRFAVHAASVVLLPLDAVDAGTPMGPSVLLLQGVGLCAAAPVDVHGSGHAAACVQHPFLIKGERVQATA